MEKNPSLLFYMYIYILIPKCARYFILFTFISNIMAKTIPSVQVRTVQHIMIWQCVWELTTYNVQQGKKPLLINAQKIDTNYYDMAYTCGLYP